RLSVTATFQLRSIRRLLSTLRNILSEICFQFLAIIWLMMAGETWAFPATLFWLVFFACHATSFTMASLCWVVIFISFTFCLSRNRHQLRRSRVLAWASDRRTSHQLPGLRLDVLHLYWCGALRLRAAR